MRIADSSGVQTRHCRYSPSGNQAAAANALTACAARRFLRTMSKPAVTITYCTQCNWLLRAGWTAQELLASFGTDLGALTLVPGTGGIFEVRVGDKIVWERKRDGGFPDIRILKQLVRDEVAPGRSLGHTDEV